MALPSEPISGVSSSPDLKARIADFEERVGDLLTHEVAEYRPPLATGHIDTTTGEAVITGLSTTLLPKEQLVYFATMLRPILFTKKEPIYFPTLAAAIGREHEALRPGCASMAQAFKNWTKHLFVGVRSSPAGPAGPVAQGPTTGYRLTNTWVAPAGTPFPQDLLIDAEMVEDFYFALIYLNGFVWHNDVDKTAEYRSADPLMQVHYRRCAEIRVFSGLQMLVKPLHRFIADGREAGEDF